MWGKKVIATYALDDDKLNIGQADIGKLTHINIAFGTLSDGNLEISHLKTINDVARIKAINPDVMISLSVVSGTTYDFSVGSSTKAGRRKIASSCAQAILKYKLDGVDLDWEYPCCSSNFAAASPEDKRNFTLLCMDIREALTEIGDQNGKHYLFTIATGADEYYTRNTEMDQVQQYLDHVYIMTYDHRCGFHTLTGHHTNLFTATGDLYRTSCQAAVKIFIEAGVPMSKIVIGAAAYSRKWDNVPNRNNGFLQLTKAAAGYGPCYDTLVEKYINKNGYKRHWDDEAKAPYLFNGSTFISYDDEESIFNKCQYIEETDCAGIFYWQYSYDSTGKLLDKMYKSLRQPNQ